MIGTSFASYAVVERLNRGGMADIYHVINRAGESCTLRVLLDEMRSSKERLRQFRWGCKVMNQLDHPNVVRLYESGKFRGTDFAVMEYVDGPNLRDRLLRNDPRMQEIRLPLLISLAAGLSHIHDRGFVHMDFKPENILLTKNYDPKIADFDLSIVRPSRPKRLSSRSGTPAYLSPEQVVRQPVDERADIFSFGLCAYELLTRRKPVTGQTREQILQKYAEFNEHLKPLRDHLPGIPRILEQVVLKCLEKDIDRRYPTMSLVLRDLQK